MSLFSEPEPDTFKVVYFLYISRGYNDPARFLSHYKWLSPAPVVSGASRNEAVSHVRYRGEVKTAAGISCYQSE